MRHAPLELFRPSSSLSTTSSAHCTDRPLEVCPPRRRSTRGDSVRVSESVLFCVVVCDVVGVLSRRCVLSPIVVVVVVESAGVAGRGRV